MIVPVADGQESVSRVSYNSKVELQRAESWILKRVQCEAFPEEVRALRENKELLTRSKLKCLNPYMKDGLILVGGRLNNSDCLETRKHPIVLPANHKVTQLIFKQTLIEQLHCGPQALLAEPCFSEPIIAALPRQKVQCTRPFSVTGVDFAGPLMIRSDIRRVVSIKTWIAVFMCFVTRAIHLEVVEDLTSKAFIAALRRFMSRRGCCNTIYSDNGTNFVGAQRELKVYITNAGLEMAQEGIEWRFNPPAAPHFGGLWESAVKSAKHHLTRMIGEAKLTLSELNTLLYQIEACLNSRPITPMSSDPSDAEALRPAHFLIGGAMTLPPEPDLSNEDLGNLRRWKYTQQYHNFKTEDMNQSDLLRKQLMPNENIRIRLNVDAVPTVRFDDEKITPKTVRRQLPRTKQNSEEHLINSNVENKNDKGIQCVMDNETNTDATDKCVSP
ncbi:uncharacterized protein LOC132938914 [Metopolophium dirhodum]|uniref:uncharacterized protein LOC132938914 n=1 Tax=Metopolophium dirhodum TaxID=44670 RepID=UPI0029900237|nr:uncharacterized protein LOC132938914 [Metopolophium dirhodum]